jgi:hypothetical protein
MNVQSIGDIRMLSQNSNYCRVLRAVVGENDYTGGRATFYAYVHREAHDGGVTVTFHGVEDNAFQTMTATLGKPLLVMTDSTLEGTYEECYALFVPEGERVVVTVPHSQFF